MRIHKLTALLLAALLLVLRNVYPKLRKKKLSPITMIVISAVFGLLLY